MASVSYGLRFLPILWSLLLVTTVVSSRLMANAIHTKEFVHTNAFQCAQSILSQLLDLLAFIGLLSIVVRYLHLEMLTKGCQEEIHTSIGRLRMASLTFGVGSMLGITVISNFRPPNDLVSQVCNHVYNTLHSKRHIQNVTTCLCCGNFSVVEKTAKILLTKVASHANSMLAENG